MNLSNNGQILQHQTIFYSSATISTIKTESIKKSDESLLILGDTEGNLTILRGDPEDLQLKLVVKKQALEQFPMEEYERLVPNEIRNLAVKTNGPLTFISVLAQDGTAPIYRFD